MTGAKKANDGGDVKVLMVCLGNICRSPMAEAVFAHEASLRPELAPRIKVDSCGTGGYHIGEEPDERTVETCQKHGVPIDSTARQLQRSDFQNFTHIIAMDENNLRNILSLRPPTSPASVALFSSYSPHEETASSRKPIADPYYGGMRGFEGVYAQCVEYSRGFLDALQRGELGEGEGREGNCTRAGL